MPAKKILFIAFGIPLSFLLLVETRDWLEFYFRSSAKYHYIYSAGSNIIMILQMLLLLFSLGFSIYLLDQRKKLSRLVFWIAFPAAALLFLYVSFALVYSLLYSR